MAILPAQTDRDGISVRLARSPDEMRAAQRLRYEVFYEEYGAKPTPLMAQNRLDFDDFDDFAEHLIVIDRQGSDEKIVGTYRLLPQKSAHEYGRFYSSDEYDISRIIASGASLLEVGRSCVLPGYRTRPVMQLLWQGIADFITDHNIQLMFGCASLHGTCIENIALPLSYLHHHHKTPGDICPVALQSRYVDMNIIPRDQIDAKKAFSALPPLIKGYLRLGATIGDGAVIDHQFNTTDVCIVVQTHQVQQRYRNHYSRKIRKPLPDQDTSFPASSFYAV